jgi:hypothetical protein
MAIHVALPQLILILRSVTIAGCLFLLFVATRRGR